MFISPAVEPVDDVIVIQRAQEKALIGEKPGQPLVGHAERCFRIASINAR